MAANAKRRSGSGSEGAAVRLLPPVLVPLSALEEEALVDSLALTLLPLLVVEEPGAAGSEMAENAGVEGGEPGAGGDL
jgi:hypothetical protein